MRIASTRSGSRSASRALRVPVQERVDVDALAARGVEPEGRVPEPGEGSVVAMPGSLEDRPTARRTCRREASCWQPSRSCSERSLADGAGQHGLAYYVLVAAVPVAAVAALHASRRRSRRLGCGAARPCRGRALGARGCRCSCSRPPIRAPLVGDGPPPRLGVTALVPCLVRARFSRPCWPAQPRSSCSGRRSSGLEGQRRGGVARDLDQRLHEEERPDRDGRRTPRPRVASRGSRGGEPPATAGCSPVSMRMYIARTTFR